jgi:hypothetical protein
MQRGQIQLMEGQGRENTVWDFLHVPLGCLLKMLTDATQRTRMTDDKATWDTHG